MHAYAKKVWKMNTDATEEQFIQLADDLLIAKNGEGLDSLDIGDALGGFIGIAESEEWSGDNDSGEWMWVGDGFTVTLSNYWELFKWNEGLPKGPFEDLTREDVEKAIRELDEE